MTNTTEGSAAVISVRDLRRSFKGRRGKRSLFLGNFGDPAIVISAILLGGLAALAFWWAMRSFRRDAA
jgi:hypothetical protein